MHKTIKQVTTNCKESLLASFLTGAMKSTEEKKKVPDIPEILQKRQNGGGSKKKLKKKAKDQEPKK